MCSERESCHRLRCPEYGGLTGGDGRTQVSHPTGEVCAKGEAHEGGCEPCRHRPHAPHGKCPGWTRAQHAQRLSGQLEALERKKS